MMKFSIPSTDGFKVRNEIVALLHRCASEYGTLNARQTVPKIEVRRFIHSLADMIEAIELLPETAKIVVED